MSTKHFNRPTSSYTGEVGLTNRTKYQDDSAASPRVPISSQKMDGDLNYLLDAVNTLYDTAVNSAIPDDSITDAKLRNSVGLSVIGRSANTTGNPADIIAASDGEVLRRSGTSIGFGQIATGGITDSAVTAVKIADTNVTYAKIQNVPTGTILGRSTAGAGSLEELTLGSGLSLASGVLSGTAPIFNNQQVFTANGTFTPAAGVTRVCVRVWGAGGGGGGATTSMRGGGGGGGEYAEGFVAVTPSVGCTVTVGTGGTGGNSSGTNGTSGGASSFAGTTTITANGGGGGTGQTGFGTVAGGAGGTGGTGGLNISGGNGSGGYTQSAVAATVGFNGGGDSPMGGQGGTCVGQAAATNGNAGQAPGGGGSGVALGAAAGGSGAIGTVVVYYP